MSDITDIPPGRTLQNNHRRPKLSILNTLYGKCNDFVFKWKNFLQAQNKLALLFHKITSFPINRPAFAPVWKLGPPVE